MLGRPDHWVPSCDQDEIDFKAHQLSCELRILITFPLSISALEGNVLAFDVADVA